MTLKTIELKLTLRDAHVVLRALASYNASADIPKMDSAPCTWVAERILRILHPELGPQPIITISARAEKIVDGEGFSQDMDTDIDKRRG